MAETQTTYYHYTTTQASTNVSGSSTLGIYPPDNGIMYGLMDESGDYVNIQCGNEEGTTGLQFQYGYAGEQGESEGDFPAYPPIPSPNRIDDNYVVYGYPNQILAPDGLIYQDTITSFPIFANLDDVIYYLQTGDDSNALNYDDLHATKIDIYATNNGDRITFKVTAQDQEAPDYYFDNIKVEFLPLVGDNPRSVLNFGINGVETNWERAYNSDIAVIGRVHTIIINKNSVVADFMTKITRKLLGLGSISCTPLEDSRNGYNIFWSIDNSFDDITNIEDDLSDASDNPNDGSQFTGFSNLCQTYKVTKQALADLGNYLWNQSIFNDIKLLNNSPLENIVSCHYMPCDIGGNNHKIAFGNLDTNVSGQLLNQNMIKVNIASFDVPLYNTGFLGLSPYTSFSLYLPFVGMVGNIDPKDVCGHHVTIDYVFDVVVGSFGVLVYTSKGGGKTLIFSSQGTCNVDVPLTASNKAQVQASILQSGVSLVGDVLSENAMGAIGDVGSIASVQNHSNTFGSPSSMVGALSPTTCYYIVRTPITNLPSNFAHTKGYMCMQTYKLSALKGFTRLSSDIDLSGFSLTQNELNRLKSILTTGFYL